MILAAEEFEVAGVEHPHHVSGAVEPVGRISRLKGLGTKASAFFSGLLW